MKKLFLILSFLLFSGIRSQSQTVPTTGKDPVEEKTNVIATRLNLDEEKKKAVYNILSQTEKRIEDLALGTPDYTKLINYINQERLDMLKSTLSGDEFVSYQKNFTTKDNSEINAYIKTNNTYLIKKAAEEDKAQKANEKIMQIDKQKIKKEEEKEKIAAKKQKEAEKKAEDKQKAVEKKEADKLKAAEKKEADKLKAAEKKEADKLKATEKKEAAKQKAAEKKEVDKLKAAEKKEAAKQKAAEKKEADKEKAAAKKEKEKEKKEEAKLKAEEKKNAAKQKALEKKQKELDKKLNKK
ncbi:MAG: hypothetical protein LBS55_04175 [Prevotellaceae bacterium]|jgi:histone H1/5|nr:hypothetical protein [Prevotellaceae bacterium]